MAATSGDQLPGLSGGVSEEGLIRWVVPYFAETPDDAKAVGPAMFGGVPQVHRTFANHDPENNSIGLRVAITFEGKDEDADEDQSSFELDFTLTKQPIETHPGIDFLVKNYGGKINVKDGRVTFPADLPAAIAGATGLSGNTERAGKKNPLFGLKTFLETGAIFRRNTVLTEVPKILMNSIGEILKEVPDSLIPTPDGRDWLRLPPRLRKRGSAIEVGENFKLSAPGGWPPTVYKLIRN